ncbi:hypothetical protein [Methanopyrus kandleri]
MFDHLFRTLFRMIDRSMEEAMREMEREIARLCEEMEKELERLEREGRTNRNVQEIKLPGGGWIRVETFQFELPVDTGGRIQEIPLEKERDEKKEEHEPEPREGMPSETFERVVDVGGVPLKLERRDRSWREENR